MVENSTLQGLWIFNISPQFTTPPDLKWCFYSTIIQWLRLEISSQIDVFDAINFT